MDSEGYFRSSAKESNAEIISHEFFGYSEMNGKSGEFSIFLRFSCAMEISLDRFFMNVVVIAGFKVWYPLDA